MQISTIHFYFVFCRFNCFKSQIVNILYLGHIPSKSFETVKFTPCQSANNFQLLNLHRAIQLSSTGGRINVKQWGGS